MLTAINSNREKVIGWDADRRDSYYCPECSQKLILRQGDVKVHHFAHQAGSFCRYCDGETEEHLLLKKMMYYLFRESGLYKEIRLEHRIGNQIADLYLKNNRGRSIAVECQVSDLDIAEFRRRTASYSYKGLYVLWVFAVNTELNKRFLKLIHNRSSRLNYQATEVERKCHRWFYGRFYYSYNERIYAVHLHSVKKWVPSSCDECLDQGQCPYPEPRQCPKYRDGYFRKPGTLREISVHPVNDMKLLCVDRKDRLKIAKFNEPSWWKV